MLASRLLLRHAVSAFRKGGFTLVELLVVIGIIAILAGVALGPITSGIKKAQQNSAVQQEHAIGLAMFAFANDNNQLYPDTSNPSSNTLTQAAAVAQALIGGSYVSDPAQFWLSGGTSTKFAGANSAAATQIAQSNISFDFTGNGGNGLSTTSSQYLPLLWSSLNGAGGTEPTLSTANAAITATPTTGGPFGGVGVAVFYCTESASFLTANNGTVTMVSSSSNQGNAPTAVVLKGQE